MNDDAPTCTLQAAAEHVFTLRRLYRERALDPSAGMLTLSLLHTHPHAGIRRLCETVAAQIHADIGAPRPTAGTAR